MWQTVLLNGGLSVKFGSYREFSLTIPSYYPANTRLIPG